MYKVYFEESFFDGLTDFVSSMKRYYFNFYSNTGIYDEDKIVEGYFKKYEMMKTDIFNEINYIYEKGIIGRKVLYSFEKIENCSFVFRYGNYKITFLAIKNNENNEIVVSSLKIEN
ncbi:hypothetical protein HUU51_05565 [Candidatus Gracilibacteria bacterium]|nr:hypothetical protein [Candidatus Gracilibacteria bacterium]